MKGVVTEFLNTFPLIWYLEKKLVGDKQIELIKTTPAECAALFAKDDVKFGIIPIGAYPNNSDIKIIANPCIASKSKVATVKLYSNKKITDIERIYVDKDSITSIILLQIILKLKYKKETFLLIRSNLKDRREFEADCAYMMIGDKNFYLKEKFNNDYDLAYEWVEWLELPFVFACWMVKEDADQHYIRMVPELKKAYRKAMADFDQLCQEAHLKWNLPIDFVKKYFTENLSYDIGSSSIKSINLFFELANKLDLIPKVNNLGTSFQL